MLLELEKLRPQVREAEIELSRCRVASYPMSGTGLVGAMPYVQYRPSRS